jgi:AcrR family transcriptional regulator
MASEPGASGSSTSTRDRIVAAALQTLRDDGITGLSARAIARRGGFNQALIFYHFGSLDSLLLAALDHTSAERIERYRKAVADAESPVELLAVMTSIHAEDRDTGHTTVVAQMISGSVARPELAPEMIARMEPWIELCEGALKKGLARLGVPAVVPLRELAYALVTFYLGVNLLTHLDEDRRIDSLFARVQELSPVLASLPESFGGPERGRT